MIDKNSYTNDLIIKYCTNCDYDSGKSTECLLCDKVNWNGVDNFTFMKSECIVSKQRYVYILFVTQYYDSHGLEYSIKNLGAYFEQNDLRILRRMEAYRRLMMRKYNDMDYKKVEITKLDKDAQGIYGCELRQYCYPETIMYDGIEETIEHIHVESFVFSMEKIKLF